ncbi:uncharacterized protein LOC125499842 [Athalia rosae]|uniref:uncharacterized protein LOC125499842 n=1 Tax=Athalia rosae TaxID=37344 RepID=UPI0020338E74|nr:uncharacterized protein LOC125499842 [Athalia rosae]
MLDRSGPRRNRLAPAGGKAYLLIAPPAPASDPRVQECPKKPPCRSQSNSGSDYLALKITDDMFKGGMEQSNPDEEKITDPSLSGKTTTEWKVIKVARNPIENSQGLKVSGVDRGNRGKDLSLNLADVVHESFVDPEAMAADFDEDDTYMRFGRELKYFDEQASGSDVGKTPRRRYRVGRNLQSVSTEDEIDEAIRDKEVGERPVEKYLRDKRTVSDDELGEKKERRTKERSVATPEEKTTTDDSEKIAATSSQNDKDRTDEEKRGLTNVEEWENNVPSVQKQRLNDEVHEREIRSVNGENRDNGDSKSGETVRSKTVKESGKSWDKMPTNDVSDANPFSRFSTRLNPRVKNENGRDENFRRNLGKKWAGGRPTNLQKFHQGRNSDHDWKRINAKEDAADDLRHSLRNGNEKKFTNKNDAAMNRETESSQGQITKESYSRRYSNDEESGSGSAKNTMLKSAQKSHPIRQGQGASFLQRVKEKKKLSEISTGYRKLPMEKTAPGNSQFEATAADEQNHPEEKHSREKNGGDSTEPQREDASQKKKFKVLLAVDNMEDDSQMDLALHGELAGKIVERIFDQVQKNDALKLALGPGLYRKHKSEDAVASDKIYRQGLDEDEVKQTEGMMRRVMELLGRLILDEVQRKTCASLPPDMKEFLQWILGVEDDDRQTDQVPSLPLVHDRDGNPHREDKFLFENGDYDEADIDELYKKVRLLKGLINEYNALTDKEKTKVQTVHDYLVRQLELLLKYIESKQVEGGQPQGALMAGEGNILQYQNAVPNKGPRQSTISPLVNAPSILRLSNATFGIDRPSKALSHYHLQRRRNSRSSTFRRTAKGRKHKNRKHKNHRRPHSDDGENGEHAKHKKKGKKGKGKSEKEKAHHRKHKGRESPAYKKLIRRAAMLRKKRVANTYEDDWNPTDSGYEEPLIYSSTGQLANRFDRKTIRKRENGRDDRFEKMQANRVIETNRKRSYPRSWTDVISGKLDDAGHSGETKKLADGPQAPSVDPEADEKKRNADTKIPSLVNAEVMLLNKREAWKNQNEQQLEEVAFGKDMRGRWREKEEFEKLKKIDKKMDGEDTEGKRRKRDGDERTRSKIDSKDNDSSPSEKGSANCDREDLGAAADSKIPAARKSNESEAENNSEANLSVAKEAVENVIEELRKPEEIGDIRGEKLEKNSDVSNSDPDVDVPPVEKREMTIARKSSVLPPSESEGSAILPLLGVSEQRQRQNQAARTEKDDQKDIADQTLGLESPTIVGLNTY